MPGTAISGRLRQKLRTLAASLAQLPGGRRTKFAVIGVWLVVVFLLGPLAGKFEDSQENDPVDYLPANAESVKAIDRLDGFPSEDEADAITVFHRDAGLTAEDRAAVERVRAAINQRVRQAINAERRDTVAETAPALISADASTALLTTPITVPEEATGDAEDLLTDTPEEVKAVLGELPRGLEAEVTGPAGFASDAVEVFNDINGTLLLATAALVLVLLIVIYRSPIFWAIPFFSVLLAEVTTRGLGYLIADAGVTVTGQSGGILPVLVFGAGTDYALLMVSRYREELRRHEDKHDAIRVALRRTSPTIVASGGTVIAALLTLSLAEVTGTSGLGPIGAMGIAMAMISMLTILPALLALFGRGAFWPFVPRVGSEGADETHGVWRRIAEWVARRPRRVWVGTTAVLVAMIAGLAFLNSDLTSGNMFRDDVDSVQGQELLEASFPAGSNAPTNVVVTDEKNVGAVRTAVAMAPGVAEVSPQVERGPAGAKLEVTLEEDPYSTDGFDLIPGIRHAARAVAGGDVLVGGPTAEEYDLRQSAARDNRLIVPIALVVVFLILAALLRAITASLVLIGTVIVSYFAALGIGAFFFENVFGFPGMPPDLPLFAFVFLVALGIDYNIFLMARVREEALTHGTRDGTIRGLAVTGAVITSAGLVLAGTFSTLAVLPLVMLTEIGFTIAVGVLIDTFLVRSLLVPALVLEIGDRIWWPSALTHLAGRGRRQRDQGRIVAETRQ
ncbi:MAG: MMPL family transporter [Thermoleophilaceae bacterium]